MLCEIFLPCVTISPKLTATEYYSSNVTAYGLKQDTGLELGGPALKTRAKDRTAANGKAGKDAANRRVVRKSIG